MTDKQTLQQKLEHLQQRWQTMQADYAEIEKNFDKENRVDEKIRLKSILEERGRELADIEQEIIHTERRIKQLTLNNKSESLRDELATLRRNKAYQEALDVARQLQAALPDDSQIAAEVAELQGRLEQSQRAKQVFARLTAHFAVLTPIITDLALVLNARSEHEHTSTISMVAEQYLDGQMQVQDFIGFCQSLLNPAQSHDNTSNNTTDQQYIRVARSISEGRTVLFLGSDIPGLYSGHNNDEHLLASQLAADISYQDFSGSLSSIAEYYQLAPGFGRNSLLDSLHKSLPDDLPDLGLYQSLARVKVSLVVVSAAYDTLLERAFRATGKPYVEIAAIIIPGEGNYKLGNIMLKYSDSTEEKTCSHEKLSELDLIKKYSIIYKLRGSFGWRNSLTLSESNYFTFAESASHIIPDYLTKQFHDREFLILGFTPEKWEDRLLAHTLLDKRQSRSEPCYTIGKTSEPLQEAFWKNQRVDQYEMEFSELDRHLLEVTR